MPPLPGRSLRPSVPGLTLECPTDAASLRTLQGHWAREEIGKAASLGWIQGYEDGTFRPDQSITRAEAMTMINRVLNRLPAAKEDLLPGMLQWPDNQDPGAWYYLAVPGGHQ